METDEKMKDVVQAVQGIVEAVPIYEDAFQPVAKEIGRALGTVGKAINLALEPIVGAVWGWERIKEFVLKRVSEKLRDIPKERIQSPDPLIAGPTLEALRWAGSNETLRELYANLLATSLDSQTAKDAHPSFVGIIRDLSPDEAKIVRFFSIANILPVIDWHVNLANDQGYQVARSNFSKVGHEVGCAFPDLTESYLDNLSRLGLIEIPRGIELTAADVYEPLEHGPQVESFRKKLALTHPETTLSFERKRANLTVFGRQFCTACVTDRLALPAPA